MSNAYRCDRCGEFETGRPAGDLREFGDPDDVGHEETYDLCSDCLGYIVHDIENCALEDYQEDLA